MSPKRALIALSLVAGCAIALPTSAQEAPTRAERPAARSRQSDEVVRLLEAARARLERGELDEAARAELMEMLQRASSISADRAREQQQGAQRAQPQAQRAAQEAQREQQEARRAAQDMRRHTARSGIESRRAAEESSRKLTVSMLRSISARSAIACSSTVIDFSARSFSFRRSAKACNTLRRVCIVFRSAVF